MSTDVARVVIGVMFVGLLGAAAVYDVRSRRIPNWIVLALLVLFIPTAVFDLQPTNLTQAFIALGIAFVVTTALWLLKVIGGGDSKLFSAAALYAGYKYLGIFAVATALAGGVIALYFMIRRPNRALVMLQMRGKGDWGKGVPYGCAIAIGAVVTGWISGFLAPHNLYKGGLP
jgi:prepilin peptidase CpaA